MRFKTRLLAGTSSLLFAAGTLTAVAPTAYAVTGSSNCGGFVILASINPPLEDQTQIGVKVTGTLARDKNTNAPVNGGGSCTGGRVRPGDLHIPQPPSTLTLKAANFTLVGNSSCASGAAAQAADATRASHYVTSGKVTFTFNETYTDQVSLLTKNYKAQAYLSIVSFDPIGPDVFDVAGIVTSGVEVGAQVSGSLWQDPVAKTGGSTGYNTGYELDLSQATGCADGTPNNAAISRVLSGGGGPSATSLLGSTATGIQVTEVSP